MASESQDDYGCILGDPPSLLFLSTLNQASSSITLVLELSGSSRIGFHVRCLTALGPPPAC
jgi:hypothetical protein